MWMDVIKLFLEFLSEIIGSIAWPLAIVILCFHFKQPIISAIGNLRSIKYGNTEATFNRELAITSEAAKAIETSDPNIADANKEKITELIKFSQSSPTSAIIAAWEEVEKAARNYVEKSGLALKSDPSRPYFHLQTFLADNKLLPRAEIETFRELRMMRNRAAHANELEITEDQARRYIRIADRLIDSIETAAIARSTQAKAD